MERFWRTLRQGCLDHLGTPGSLQDVQVRLLAFLGQLLRRASADVIEADLAPAI
jgi:hypothetical protein